jgi:hypothetical protein
MKLAPVAAPRSEMGRRLEQLVGLYLAMDGDRLNFLTDIHVRASHYRLAAGQCMSTGCLYGQRGFWTATCHDSRSVERLDLL